MHRVVIFNEKLAEVAQKYVKKGSKIYVEGQLTTRKWTDQSGQERYTTESSSRASRRPYMLDGRSGGGGEAGASSPDDDAAPAMAGGGGGGRPAARGKAGELDDDIPF